MLVDTDDYPLLLTERVRIILGKGPSLFVYDRSMIPNQELPIGLWNANKNNIPLQVK